VEHLIRYIAQFDPHFPQRVRGAAAHDITLLEQLVRFPLPVTYRAFLAAMGPDVGGLELFVQGTSCISDVIDYYQRWVITNQIKVPPKGIVFWFAALPDNDLMLQSCDGKGEPRVYEIEEDTILGPYADSLEQLLFQRAFLKYRLNPLPYQRWYSKDKGMQQLQQAATLAQDLGISIHPFSDSLTLCAETKDAALYFQCTPEQGEISLRLGAAHSADLERLGPYFAERLNLQRRD
jgi:hypothetical protein